MLPLESFQTKTCPDQWKVDQTKMLEETSLCIQMTDPQGCPLDLSHADQPKKCYEGQPAPQSSSSMSSQSASSQSSPSASSSSQSSSSSSQVPEGAPLPPGWYARYRVGELYDIRPLFELGVRVEDAATGMFSVKIPAAELEHPGVFLSEIAIYDQKKVRRISEFRYLQVAPTLEYLNEGAITIPEIRLALLDFPCKNTLLDDVEFTDLEITHAIRRPIDRWNETSPNIKVYTVVTFPWREHWMIGTVGYLLRTAAHHYRRNHLTYQAAGLSVADKDKFNQYDQAGTQYIQEYDTWMRNKKIEINVAQGFGTLSSAYGRYWFFR